MLKRVLEVHTCVWWWYTSVHEGGTQVCRCMVHRCVCTIGCRFDGNENDIICPIMGMSEENRKAVAKMFEDYVEKQGPTFDYLVEKGLLAPHP